MLFNKLLGKKPDLAPDSATGTTSAPPIKYNPKLIPELLAEHRALQDVFNQLELACAAGNVAETSALLEYFGGLLTAHFLKEDFRLYVYLENALGGDPRTRALVRQLYQEMDGIGKAVLAFLAKYRSIGADPALPENFAADLAELGKSLQERVEREERTLYPMYLPAY